MSRRSPAELGRAAAVLAGAQQWMDALSLSTDAKARTDAGLDLFRQHGYTHRDAVPVDDHTTAHSLWRLSPSWRGRSSRNARSGHRYPHGSGRTPGRVVDLLAGHIR